MSVPVIVTFDIDGTIVRSTKASSNTAHKDSFVHAAVTLFPDRVEPGHSIEELSNVHGSTDGIIASLFCEKFGGIPFDEVRDQLPHYFETMADYFDASCSGLEAGLEVIPGVKQAMQHLLDTGALVGLVTGNVQRIAWGKMKAVGLFDYFSEPKFGGFGSDVMSSGTDNEAKYRDRGEQIKFAVAKARAMLPAETDEACVKCFHIGDAPSDVLAAEYAGVTPIGVAQGIFSAEELQTACPAAIVLPSLEDLTAFIAALGVDKKGDS